MFTQINYSELCIATGNQSMAQQGQQLSEKGNLECISFFVRNLNFEYALFGLLGTVITFIYKSSLESFNLY